MTDESRALVVGIDFGTLSGRAVVVRVRDGAELGSAVHTYAHGVLDRHLPDRPDEVVELLDATAIQSPSFPRHRSSRERRRYRGLPGTSLSMRVPTFTLVVIAILRMYWRACYVGN